jgi:hypothetical protein
MSGRILYVDRAEVRAGRLEELKRAMGGLVELVEANEPQLEAYEVYFAEEGTMMTVVHSHVDSASLERHMSVAGPAFSKFVDLVRLMTIDVYGTPSDALMEQVRHKAALLGTATVTVHERHGGFARRATG